MKKIIALFLSFIITFSVVAPAFASTSSDLPSASVQEILSDFNIKRTELALSQSNVQTTMSAAEPSDISEDFTTFRQETINNLSDLGYSVYEVTSVTYDNVERELNTDLSSLGIQRGGSYMVVIGGSEAEGRQSRKDTSNSYSHLYGGEWYTLRTVMVTGEDNRTYIQANSVNLLSKHSDALIENMLNATVGAYTSFVGVPTIVGTIASLTGLKVFHFTSSNDSTAVYHGGSSWTKMFTQVWDNNFNQWVSGSVVEIITQVCTINGLRYDSSENRCVNYTSLDKVVITESKEWGNAKWRNDNAVVSYIGAFPQISDRAGDALYVYDSKIIIRHLGGFI